VAHELGRQRLRMYWHRFSPKTFTLPQLFACLVLKEFLRLDYRKLSALLEDAPGLAASIGLEQVPHITAFYKAAVRLLSSRRAQRLLDQTVNSAIERRSMKPNRQLAAIDGTGFETRHISAYFVRRRKKACKIGYQTTTSTRYPYANLVCDCASHMLLGAAIRLLAKSHANAFQSPEVWPALASGSLPAGLHVKRTLVSTRRLRLRCRRRRCCS
jgi:hypothetical protein